MQKIIIEVLIQKNSKTNCIVRTQSNKGSIGLSVSHQDVATGESKIQSAVNLGLKDAMRIRDSLNILIKNFEKI